MASINQNSVPEKHRISPKGKYEIYRKQVSLAIGGIKDVGPWGGGHPFDIELARIPCGKVGYPLHSHAAQTEYYIILQGAGILRIEDRQAPVYAGDHFICLPGVTHQIINNSYEDLIYYVIADHHRSDVTTYPESDKRQIKPEYRYFHISDVDYYDGEE